LLEHYEDTMFVILPSISPCDKIGRCFYNWFSGCR